LRQKYVKCSIPYDTALYRDWQTPNISSIAGVSGLSFHSPDYSASKAGVIGLTRSVGLEVIGAGINVNAVACGGILTETWEAAFKAMVQNHIGRRPDYQGIGHGAVAERMAAHVSSN
jgi:NAD(P)-dependent dehydrogenase (short-subunit alcohol dehydrogenase family)